MSEVNRFRWDDIAGCFIGGKFDDACTADEVIDASDHDRIVAELNAEVKAQKERIAALESKLRDAGIVVERYCIPYHKDERVFICSVCRGWHQNQSEIEHGMSCDIRALLP